MRKAWKRSSRRRRALAQAVRTLHAVETDAVTGATRAFKDLRCASMNSANLSPFALSLTALFAPVRTVDRGCYAQLTQHQFIISIGSDDRGQTGARFDEPECART
jgi:hypothetical protein